MRAFSLTFFGIFTIAVLVFATFVEAGPIANPVEVHKRSPTPYPQNEDGVVDHADGERQQITLHDVNQDQRDTNGFVDMLREEVLHALAGTPDFSSAALGPAGETQPGWAVMGEQGAGKIMD
ncbi:hypothetical protein F5H01DRAFT_355853 [Linnemannia elongata]|nr:hypothetical protein F5H01DRAFT_355853 [Linnemannia elongata]